MGNFVRFALVLLLIVAAWITSKFFAQSGGYVYVNYLGYTIETTLWVALILLIGAFSFIAMLFWCCFKVERVVSVHKRRCWFRHKQTLNQAQQRTIIALALGQSTLVGSDTLTQKRKHQTNQVHMPNWLITILKLIAEEQYEQVRQRLNDLSDTSKKPIYIHAVLDYICTIRLNKQIDHHGLSESLLKQFPKDSLVIALVHQYWVSTQQWDRVDKLMPALKKYVADTQYLMQAECTLAIGKIQNAISGQQFQKAQRIYRKVPHSHSVITQAYGQALVNAGQAEAAAEVVLAYLNKQWDEDLVPTYVAMPIANQAKIHQLIQWLETHSTSVHVLMGLARLAHQDGNKKQAQSYWFKAIKQAPHGLMVEELSGFNEVFNTLDTKTNASLENPTDDQK